MDDVLVFGANEIEHNNRLKMVLDRVLDAGMTLNESKCQFGVTRIEFLGYIVDKRGIHAGPRMQGIHDFPRPESFKAVRSFLGLANQFARFSDRLADSSKPLRDLLRHDVVWVWNESQEKSFHAVKALFKEPPVLATYSSLRETYVTTDASNRGLGATLSQIQADGSRRLVAAASRSLTECEQRYAAIEKEALGVCWAMDKFSQYILGMKNVIVETDHKPLIPLLGNMFLDRLPPRIQRFKLRLQRFQYSIRHISGKGNMSADALSRYTISDFANHDEINASEVEFYVNETVTLNGLDSRLETLRLEQSNDEILVKVQQYTQNGWPTYLSSVDVLLRPSF